jgi:hypothetical protein
MSSAKPTEREPCRGPHVVPEPATLAPSDTSDRRHQLRVNQEQSPLQLRLAIGQLSSSWVAEAILVGPFAKFDKTDKYLILLCFIW